MCGIVGWAEPGGRAPAGGGEQAERALGRALQRMAHRGPDGRAVWLGPGVALGHARLAVRDPGAPGAAQPIATPDGRFVLTFNGELYDDARWRAELEGEVARRTGDGFRTRCDAETLLWALVLRGASALDRVRGMYALGLVDVERRSLLLARDPLGVKPLFHATTRTGGVAFASEVAGLRALGCIDADRLDPEAIPAYLATSRRTLLGRTLVAGVRSLRPGEVVRVDLDERLGALTPRTIATGGRFEESVAADPEEADALSLRTRDVVAGSVASHLASDVPLCGLLSGGLDSAAVTWSALRERPGALATFCAAGVEDGAPLGEDPAAAEECARALGTDHTFVGVSRADFAREWQAHVAHLEQPLSTPNEIAIAAISRAISASGAVVALSGEGADELFGGYGDALALFVERGGAPDEAADFHLTVSSWFDHASQAELLRGGLADALETTRDEYRAEFRRLRTAAGPAAGTLEPHLRLQREVNLTGLLERLDAATMRASVEGRTPFADLEVARHAARLPARHKFAVDPNGPDRSKIALRAAFEGVLPRVATSRAKASFPLPFERWCEDVARPAMQTSDLLADVLRPGVLPAIDAGALGAQTWRAWWLFGNLALTDQVLSGRLAEGGGRTPAACAQPAAPRRANPAA